MHMYACMCMLAWVCVYKAMLGLESHFLGKFSVIKLQSCPCCYTLIRITAQASLEFMILLPLPKCGDYSCEPHV